MRASISAAFDSAVWRQALMRWYRANGRHALPWRLTRDPYAVLVSEVMLQQTQVDRVLPYYTAWLERWPTLAALAEATPAEVIREWRGLGYNRRALNLYRLAVAVTSAGAEQLPAAPGALSALPGIGPYTASAIECFARGEAVAVVDTNIARVLARLVAGVANHRELTPKTVRAIATEALPARRVRDHNLALMDLGAMVCQARGPRCMACPVARWCCWRASGYPQPGLSAKPLPPFRSTARFARGRIIDTLRDSPASEAELASMLPALHRAHLADYLEALREDGLVVKGADGMWALPA